MIKKNFLTITNDNETIQDIFFEVPNSKVASESQKLDYQQWNSHMTKFPRQNSHSMNSQKFSSKLVKKFSQRNIESKFSNEHQNEFNYQYELCYEDLERETQIEKPIFGFHQHHPRTSWKNSQTMD